MSSSRDRAAIATMGVFLAVFLTSLGMRAGSAATSAAIDHSAHVHATNPFATQTRQVAYLQDGPSGGTWTQLPDMPAGGSSETGARKRQEHATVAVGTKVYAIGGVIATKTPGCFLPSVALYNASYCTTNSVDVFDTATGQWAPIGTVAPIGNAAPIPDGDGIVVPFRHNENPNRITALLHPNAAVVNGKIYVLGGMGPLPFPAPDFPWYAMGNSYVYDPATNHWSDLPPVPAAFQRGAGAIAVSGTKIYIAGGTKCHEGFRGECTSYANVAGMFTSYDTATGVWTQLPNLPHATDQWTGHEMDGIDHMPGAIAHDPATPAGDLSMYIFGGRQNTIDKKFNQVFAFDLTTNTWSEKTPMPTARSDMWYGTVGGNFYVMGGAGKWDPYSASNPVNPLCPVGLPPSLGVPCQPPLNSYTTPYWGTFDNNEAYNFATNTWTKLAPMPNPRHGSTTAVIGGSIYLPGGSTHETLGTTSYFDKFTP